MLDVGHDRSQHAHQRHGLGRGCGAGRSGRTRRTARDLQLRHQQFPVQVKRFSELYPKIKVTTYVASCWQTYNRHVAERGAGRPIADALIPTDDVFMKMDDEGLLEGYASPELAHFPKDTRPDKANYIRYKALLAAFTINTETMKGRPVPQDWTDFGTVRAEWKDQISFYDPRTSSLAFTVLATLHQQLGAEGARRIYAGLMSMNAELSSSTPAGTAKLLSGEKPIMFYILTNQYGATVAKGAPLVFNVPKSGAIGTHFGVATLKGAPHPNAAELLGRFHPVGRTEGRDQPRRICVAHGRGGSERHAGTQDNQDHADRLPKGVGRPEIADRILARRHRHTVTPGPR